MYQNTQNKPPPPFFEEPLDVLAHGHMYLCSEIRVLHDDPTGCFYDLEYLGAREWS